MCSNVLATYASIESAQGSCKCVRFGNVLQSPAQICSPSDHTLGEVSAPDVHMDVFSTQNDDSEGPRSGDGCSKTSIGLSFSKLKYRLKNLSTQMHVLQVGIPSPEDLLHNQ